MSVPGQDGYMDHNVTTCDEGGCEKCQREREDDIDAAADDKADERWEESR